MSMLKRVDPLGHQKRLCDEPVAQIKFSSKGLTGEDYRSFVKRASVFDREQIAKLIKPGEVPLHVIALGCDEFFGPNRNGDAFTKQACREYHVTFVKLGHWFRNHDHDDPRRSRGVVKASAFNEALGRIELVVALNGTKEAAKRNKGLVADRELEALESGKPLAVSMACKVAYDVCSGCGNKAKNREEYCDESICKYGGAKNNLGRTFDDGHTLRVFNPEPYFFDISYVPVPADRVAYSLGTIKLARLQTVPSWLYQLPTESEVQEQENWLTKLAFWETQAQFGLLPALKLPPETVKYANLLPSDSEPNELVYTLTKHGILLPLSGFLRCFGDFSVDGAVKLAQLTQPYLYTAFNDLLRDPKRTEILATNIFYPKEPIVQKKLAIIFTKKANLHTAQPSIRRAIILENKQSNLYKLARLYALYQLASVAGWQGVEPKEFVCQRAISINLGE